MRTLSVVTVVGARPQFVKAAAIRKAIDAHNASSGCIRISEKLLHTGQHYDAGLSQVFFDELGIPAPEVNRGVGSDTHGRQTARMLAGIEEFFENEIHGIRRFGTAALDLCQVGCGQFGGYFEYQLSPWDFAVGALFVEEAGGKVTNANGDPLPVAGTSIVASNTKLHDKIIDITSRHHPR